MTQGLADLNGTWLRRPAQSADPGLQAEYYPSLSGKTSINTVCILHVSWSQ